MAVPMMSAVLKAVTQMSTLVRRLRCTSRRMWTMLCASKMALFSPCAQGRGKRFKGGLKIWGRNGKWCASQQDASDRQLQAQGEAAPIVF